MSEIEVRLGGVETVCWEHGSGEPLVWVMGTGMSGRAWHGFQIPAFEDRYRCITYDMRGVGAAGCPDEPYTPAVLAGDLVELLDLLEVTSAHFVGFSLGSCTIQELAIMAPERVSSLVLMSTWSNTGLEHHVRRHYESRKYALEHATLDVFSKFAFWMWAPSFVDDQHDQLLQREEYLSTVTGSRDLSGFIGHFAADLAHDTLERLAGISCPTLVIHGDEDLITRPAYNARVAELIPDARRASILRAGHLAFLERPDEMNRAIAEFLAS
jgi:pimeloyl-ACP methyl ester carboxylesterase